MISLINNKIVATDPCRHCEPRSGEKSSAVCGKDFSSLALVEMARGRVAPVENRGMDTCSPLAEDARAVRDSSQIMREK